MTVDVFIWHSNLRLSDRRPELFDGDVKPDVKTDY
jgi:hypothetical protein